MAKRFLRRWWNKKSRLGKGRKKKQKWRKPKGRHNKMREKRKGYAKSVSIGYRKPKAERQRAPLLIRNAKELVKAKGSGITEIILARTGRKKRAEIAKKAGEIGIKIKNQGKSVKNEA